MKYALILLWWMNEWYRCFLCKKFWKVKHYRIRKNTFQVRESLLCDFHREQAWTRWLSKVHNRVSEEKEIVLDMLRKCAHALSVNEYEQSVHNLQHSSQWLKYPRLRNWFTKTWLTEYKVWSVIFSSKRDLLLNTHTKFINQMKSVWIACLDFLDMFWMYTGW